MKDIIIQMVFDNVGIRGPALITRAITLAYDTNRGEEVWGCDLPELLSKMVQDGELVEVEYTLPDSDYRLRSIYFPKGTIIVAKPLTPNEIEV